MEEYRGAQTVAVYTDPRSEFAALRSGCGVYDLGWRAKILLAGSDRVRWLNGMVTNNVRDLGVGRGVYAFLLNPQGHILGDLYAYNRGEHLLVDADQSQAKKLLEVFDHYIIMDDVEVTNISEKLTAIGVAGPKSRETLKAVRMEVPELNPSQLSDITWDQVGLTVVRGDNPAIESYELWLAPANRDQLWDALGKAGTIPVGSEALELLRIAAGIPRYGQDIRERDLPQETEQTRALHFSKGCYVGQEIVERIRSRGAVHRKFAGFTIQGSSPTPGTKIQAGGKEVGEITSAASLPGSHGDFAVALGYIRREAGATGKQVEISGGPAIVSELPFAEAFKN